ncbi:transposase domain-containing protein, partial [Cereibacter changlensis]|uniref:transposase domain-containing protein n=1 Tax=Cereibacter changlensis TaxID=402884 RepID=UPI00200A01CB
QTARIYACQRARPAGVDRKAHASGNGPQQIARHGQNERAMALGRKNALFAGHDEGGQSWARFASVIGTCRLNGVEPYAWLTAALEAIAGGHPKSDIDALLPWNFPKVAIKAAA